MAGHDFPSSICECFVCFICSDEQVLNQALLQSAPLFNGMTLSSR